MFALNTQRLRRRLSVPTSGSVRRRARERRRAERTRLEGERLARERREQRRIEKIEQQKKAREELASYEPWGRAGGGAPNPHGFRFSDLRAKGIYPEDELKGTSVFEEWRRWSSPKRRQPRTPIRLHEDPQLFFAEQLKRAVDNDIRYKQTSDQQRIYKEILDDMVDKRHKAIRDEKRKNLEYERKMTNGNKSKNSRRKDKFVKRLGNGELVVKTIIDDGVDNTDVANSIENKQTPEGAILRLTGGIELVPLLARRRRVGARTLPSSDVTRPPQQSCQWREMFDVDYLGQLKHQMRVKCEQKEESRRASAESVRLHHVTWSSLWGRPGHGAPQQRGRYARNNLAQLLYVPPLTDTRAQN
ncbi:unnamed protein product, partial [Iphiclides podalirius]